ncbi:MAG: NPCBM/NEW2 domain-containing protein [Limisphaerales bacterium]
MSKREFISGMRPVNQPPPTRLWPGRAAAGLVYLLLAAALRAAEPSSRESAVTPLGELDPVSAQQGWGSLAVDRSVWGKPMQIGDRRFATGLGTHANSELVYDLEQSFERFEAWVGVDAAMMQHPEASVVFKVVADGREVFNSGVMRVDSPARRVSLAVKDVSELKLVVTDAGDGINADHADWAEAMLLEKPKAPAPLSPPRPARFHIRARDLEIGLSDQGEIVGASIGRVGLRRSLQGGTALARCTNAGAVSARKTTGGGVEFTRQIVHAPSGQRATLTERFLPAKDSVRWEIEIRGAAAPWSTGIETRLRWPATNMTRFWTAWEDPEQKRDVWRDPLVLRPLVNQRLSYGAAHWDEEQPGGYQPTSGDGFVIPILTLAEPEPDAAISLALSPEDALLEMTLTARKDGSFVFRRNDHRISRTNTVRFAMDLVAHGADWRGGLGWMTRRYPEFFNPPNPRARAIAGLGAYSDWEGDLDAAKLRRMGFRVNWKASYDFPYMGMFLPPIPDDEKYPRLVKRNLTSIAQLRDYSTRMRRMGFHVLNYFNVTEFGATSGQPAAADPTLKPADRWKNVHNFMRDEVADGILLDRQGRPYGSWEGSEAMDCGGPKYRAFLLEQARRHIEKLPDSDGICIDRLDWLRFYNLRADDGQSWRRNQSCRSLYLSWRGLLAELGPMFHAADKIILVNAMVNRTELLRHVDGIYHEFGHVPGDLNGAAVQCVLKPCIAWTPDESTLKPDPDAYFQRHLHLGVFPTAPLPANDHTIAPSAWADRWYLDYGPLMDALHGRQWVLVAHCVEAITPGVKVNLFQVPGGYALPVTFGGSAGSATVRLRNVNGLGKVNCEALHPGVETPVPVLATFRHDELELQVPLKRGCAMVRLTTGGTKKP